MHPALKPLDFLIGSWRSVSAKGKFPNIKDFTYEERISFESIGQPMLNFTSYSRMGDRPMHGESGYLRINPGTNKVAFLVAHNFGITTIEEGTVEDKTITLESTEIRRMSFAKDPAVTKIKRTINVVANRLIIKTDMATTTVPELTNHLVVLYERTSYD